MLLTKFKNLFPELVRSLTNARINGRLAHAYMLYGDNMELREQFSTLLFQIISCPNINDKGEPCGSCKTCDQLYRKVYADLYTLVPSSKARNIKIGDDERDEGTTRWFEHQFYMSTTSEVGKKLGLIDDADCMNVNAQNAFLKTLEEPPSDSFFILATGSPSSLLPTIISRCQTILLLTNRCDYLFAGATELFKALHSLQFEAKGQLVKAENCAQQIISISKGLKSEAENEEIPKWEERLEMAKELQTKSKFKQLEEKSKAAVQAVYLTKRKQFLSAIHTWFAQIYQLSCGVQISHIANATIFDNVEELPKQLDEKLAFKDLEKAEELLSNLNFNVNEELALRNFCIEVARTS